MLTETAHTIKPTRQVQHLPGHPLFFKPGQPADQASNIYGHEANTGTGNMIRLQSPGTTPFFQSKTLPAILIQKKCNHCEEEEQIQKKGKSNTAAASIAPPLVHDVISSPGEALDPFTKGFMESRFGYSFENVQIHNDALAHQSAAEVNALAYAHDNHVVFGKGQYNPETTRGKQLLAHELAHVIQQNHGLIARQQAPVTVATPMPRGATAVKAGGFSVQINYITVTVLPDVLNSPREQPRGAHTYMVFSPALTIPTPDYKTDPTTKLVTSFVPYPALQIGLTVETNYGSSVNPAGPSDYGYGTRPQDKGRKTIRFHEGSHGSEFIDYIKREIRKYPLPVFQGKTGMTEKDFLQKDQEYVDQINKIHQMLLAASHYATQVVDCAGKSIDKHNAGRRGYQNVCP